MRGAIVVVEVQEKYRGRIGIRSCVTLIVLNRSPRLDKLMKCLVAALLATLKGRNERHVQWYQFYFYSWCFAVKYMSGPYNIVSFN